MDNNICIKNMLIVYIVTSCRDGGRDCGGALRRTGAAVTGTHGCRDGAWTERLLPAVRCGETAFQMW